MERDDTLYTLIIFSENLPGVLNHITTVFTRRQINIESLNVSASSIEGLHRYATYSIVTMEGITEEITNLYKHLKVLDCILQFVHSGSIAVTKSRREFVSEFIASRNRKRFGLEE